MSYLFFMDESGHDHRATPYEVRGGFALHARELWSFVRDLERLEQDCFGVELQRYGSEIKGSKLLEKRRFEWAKQDAILEDEERHKHVKSFFRKGQQKQVPNRVEFTAYGQACLQMADGVFQTLFEHKATVFASCIPRGIKKAETFEAEAYLRKDQVFLLERYFYFLEKENEQGLLVLDETDKVADRKFVHRLEDYFRRSTVGKLRATKVVPSPFFVSSEMTYPIQVADLCIYCINWGFRAVVGMNEPFRKEIRQRFSPWLERLQFRGDGYKDNDGQVYKVFGIIFIPDPYLGRK